MEGTLRTLAALPAVPLGSAQPQNRHQIEARSNYYLKVTKICSKMQAIAPKLARKKPCRRLTARGCRSTAVPLEHSHLNPPLYLFKSESDSLWGGVPFRRLFGAKTGCFGPDFVEFVERKTR